MRFYNIWKDAQIAAALYLFSLVKHHKESSAQKRLRRFFLSLFYYCLLIIPSCKALRWLISSVLVSRMDDVLVWMMVKYASRS